MDGHADGAYARIQEAVGGQIQGRQRACDGHHSRHSVCSNWPDAVVLEVERRELGLLVAQVDRVKIEMIIIHLFIVEGSNSTFF